MPSARELLEEADALMRKNRVGTDGDIPLLTDAVADAPEPRSVTLPVSSASASATAPDGDVPLLTDAVEETVLDFETERLARGATMEGDPSDWLVMDTIDPASHSITGRAPDTLAVVPPVTRKAAGSAATPLPLGSQGRGQSRTPRDVPAPIAAFSMQSPPLATAPSAAESLPASDDREPGRALAEQISMQVLQRLDLFTDSGMKEQLAQRLQPIVEHASAELVSAITEQVGRLVRAYVAEAIEREIAEWRRDQHRDE